MSRIMVHSTKYDGSLHYRFPTRLVARAPGLLTVHLARATPLESYRGPVPSRHDSLILYWPDRYYSLIVDWDAAGRPCRHYANIATPACWDDGAVRFIDLDLDVIWSPDGRVHLDDQDEFDDHRVRWGYPAALVARVHETVAEIRRLIAAAAYPFDGSLYGRHPSGGPRA